jgi:hypothetical protein
MGISLSPSLFLSLSLSHSPGFITPGELKPFLHAALPQPTLFPLITSHLPVGKFLELSQFIARLWKSKLTPWYFATPRVHVLLRGLCGGKLRRRQITEE